MAPTRPPWTTPGPSTSAVTSDPALAVVDVVPPPADLTGTVTPDGVAFTWVVTAADLGLLDTPIDEAQA